MKKRFPRLTWKIKRSTLLVFLTVVLFSSFTRFALAAADFDRQFALTSIGVLRAWDNIDGLFGDYVANAYKEFFAQESRFLFNDLSAADPVLTDSTIPYYKLIYDPEVLEKLARVTKTESILRTKVIREQGKYTFVLEWLHSPKMEVLAEYSFSVDEPSSGSALDQRMINQAIQTHLLRLFAKIPIAAQVTGRDRQFITVNVGSHSQVNVGDILEIATLDSVKKHPLLKTIVAWNFAPTGKAVVEQTEDGMAFARIQEEEPGREVMRYQKVVGVIHPSRVSEGSSQAIAFSPVEPETIPKIGWVGGALLAGAHQWQYSSSSPSVTLTGGGLTPGGKAAGELWFTERWFLGADLRYSFWNFTQQDASTGLQTGLSQNGGVSGSVLTMKGELGYAFLTRGGILGPKGWAKLGLKTTSYSLPISSAASGENTGPIDITSVMIGLGADIPLRHQWGALGQINFRIISFAEPTWINDTVSGTTDVDLFLGGYYRFSPRLTVRGGLDFLITGVDFLSGTSVTQKTITIGPSLLYYL